METLAWKWQKHQDDIIEVLMHFLLTLIHFTSMFYFYTPWKHLKTIGLLMFLWGLELERWCEMYWNGLNKCTNMDWNGLNK